MSTNQLLPLDASDSIAPLASIGVRLYESAGEIGDYSIAEGERHVWATLWSAAWARIENDERESLQGWVDYHGWSDAFARAVADAERRNSPQYLADAPRRNAAYAGHAAAMDQKLLEAFRAAGSGGLTVSEALRASGIAGLPGQRT